MFFELRKIQNYVTIEPYIFFMVLAYSAPIEQLQQDKLCIQRFHQSIDYCLNVSESKTSEMKLAILSQSNTLSLYATIIYTTFGVIWCLLIGCLCDKHVKLRKPFLIMAPGSILFGNILGMFQVVFFNELGIKMIIASHILPSFVGSFQVGLTLSFAYIATHSTEANRALKYFTFNIAYIIALAIGSLVSGQLLGHSSWIRGSEIRNYSSMYIIGIFSAICSILWISFAVESIDKSAPNENNQETNNNQEKEKINYRLMIKEIFDVKEIVLSFKNALAKHSRDSRHQILILICAIVVLQLEQIGMDRILFSYTQRAYRWDFEMYSVVSSVSSVTGPVVSMIALPLLTKMFKFYDIEVALVGVVSLLLSTISIGSILTPTGFLWPHCFWQHVQYFESVDQIKDVKNNRPK